jgi:hypothetical protein
MDDRASAYANRARFFEKPKEIPKDFDATNKPLWVLPRPDFRFSVPPKKPSEAKRMATTAAAFAHAEKRNVTRVSADDDDGDDDDREEEAQTTRWENFVEWPPPRRRRASRKDEEEDERGINFDDRVVYFNDTNAGDLGEDVEGDLGGGGGEEEEEGEERTMMFVLTDEWAKKFAKTELERTERRKQRKREEALDRPKNARVERARAKVEETMKRWDLLDD